MKTTLLGALIAASVVFAPLAQADDHSINPQTELCPGGKRSIGFWGVFKLYCDGLPYADGSHWHSETAPESAFTPPAQRSWGPVVCVGGACK